MKRLALIALLGLLIGCSEQGDEEVSAKSALVTKEY